MNKYKIAIPTYKRYNLIKNKTIKLLNHYNIDKSIIYIFVANEEEYTKYKLELPEYNIVVGELGINNQREYIKHYFNVGECILFMDDDIDEVLELNKEAQLYKLDDLDIFIKYAFDECIDTNSYLWGVYPVNNGYFMKSRPKINNKLSFILGTFYGQIIRHSPDLITHAKQKEDVENSILHFKKDKIITRFEYITIKTKYYNTNGGISSLFNDRDKVNEDDAKYLEKHYSNYGKMWKRKNGKYEFRLFPNITF